MFPALLVAGMLISAPTTEVSEVWEGKLAVEYIEVRPNQRRVVRNGEMLPVTLRITRTGTTFTGEWIEGDRSLAIEGVIQRGKFECAPTRVLKGTWNQDILNDLKISGSFNDKQMKGLLYGSGNKCKRGGQFVLKKKL